MRLRSKPTYFEAAKAESNYIEHRGTPSISSVDGNLIRAFVRLDMQTVYNGSINTTGVRERFSLFDLTGMPIRFRSFKEAGYYRDLVMTKWMHFMDTVLKGGQNTNEGQEIPTVWTT